MNIPGIRTESNRTPNWNSFDKKNRNLEPEQFFQRFGSPCLHTFVGEFLGFHQTFSWIEIEPPNANFLDRKNQIPNLFSISKNRTREPETFFKGSDPRLLISLQISTYHPPN